VHFSSPFTFCGYRWIAPGDRGRNFGLKCENQNFPPIFQNKKCCFALHKWSQYFWFGESYIVSRFLTLHGKVLEPLAQPPVESWDTEASRMWYTLELASNVWDGVSAADSFWWMFALGYAVKSMRLERNARQLGYADQNIIQKDAVITKQSVCDETSVASKWCQELNGSMHGYCG
jgi:hypothetical protein